MTVFLLLLSIHWAYFVFCLSQTLLAAAGFSSACIVDLWGVHFRRKEQPFLFLFLRVHGTRWFPLGRQRGLCRLAGHGARGNEAGADWEWGVRAPQGRGLLDARRLLHFVTGVSSHVPWKERKGEKLARKQIYSLYAFWYAMLKVHIYSYRSRKEQGQCPRS